MVKVLLCGQVDGHWALVWDRVRKLNAAAKGAPFEALLCVGRALPLPSEYVSGKEQVPVPTYFITADEDPKLWEGDAEQDAIWSKVQSVGSGDSVVQVLPNCFFLGRSGVAKIAGLNIAFLSGNSEKEGAISYAKADVDALQTLVEKTGEDVDFFLSAQYPAHFQHLLPEQQIPVELKATQTSTELATLLQTLAPRYHITSPARGSDDGVFYQRLPYVTECKTTGRKRLTRLIGLCGVNTSKDKTKKYLHALQVTPCAASQGEQLDIPAGTTQNPYVQFQVHQAQQQRRAAFEADSHGPNKRQRVDPPRSGLSAEQVAALTSQSNQGSQFFYDQQIAARGQHPGALRPQDRRQNNRAPPVPERTECWFCLATPSVERHLIVSIGQEAYLAMPKGAINADHVLIVPIAHEASTATLSSQTLAEIERFKSALRKYFHAQDKELLVFDRNIQTIGATHCHLQLVGVPRDRAADAKQVFIDEGEKYRVQFQEIDGDANLRKLTNGKSYFYAEVPDGRGGATRLLNFVEEKQYMQFGRHAAACVLGVPRRANWKFCVVPKDEEDAMTKQFKAQWKPFDFTLEYDE